MHPNLNQALTSLPALGITELNEMQQASVEKIPTGEDLVLLSPTGSGKTLAFMLGIVARLDPAVRGVQAIVVAPSRELVLQLEQVFKSLKTAFKVTACYGGHAMKVETNSLLDAPAVLIASPGRLIEHLERKTFDPSTVILMVLDEFDKTLQLGFHEQLRMIFNVFPQKLQLILTSATTVNTFPEFLPLTHPETLDFIPGEENTKLTLNLVRTTSVEKVQTLVRLVASFNQEVCLVFCNHIEAVRRISALLHQHRLAHGILHGELQQIDREKNLIRFRGGAHNVLIATDLVARGLDIPEIRHIVHYQVPPTEKAFIHRNGRTARMHARGDAYLVLANDESLPTYLEQSVREYTLPETFVLPPPPAYECLYISAGKKEKISRGDVAGFLMKGGGVAKEDVGLITILDQASFVCVKRDLAAILAKKLNNQKIKKVNVRVAVAN